MATDGQRAIRKAPLPLPFIRPDLNAIKVLEQPCHINMVRGAVGRGQLPEHVPASVPGPVTGSVTQKGCWYEGTTHAVGELRRMIHDSQLGFL